MTDNGSGSGLAAVAFDIDGVFKYGREWSPDGYSALQRLAGDNAAPPDPHATGDNPQAPKFFLTRAQNEFFSHF